MNEHQELTSIPLLGAGTRRPRSASVSDAEFLRRLLDAHVEIVDAGHDLKKIVEVVTRRAQELTHSSGAVVELLDGDELVYWAGSGSVKTSIGLRMKTNASLSGLCAKTGRVLVCEDSETDPRVDKAACRRVVLRSMLVAPLPYGDKIIGVLKVVSPWVKAYGPNDVRTLELLNTLIGAAIANAAQHENFSSGQPSASVIDALALGLARERIQRTLSMEDFEIVCQPIVNIETGTICGFETLSRFSAMPGRSPDKWFEEAGRVNLGIELEIVAIQKSLAMLQRTPHHTYVAINASPATIMRREVEALCLQHETDRIVFEITEHTSVDDYDALNACITRLRRFGIRFSIDDFGAGFSSLRHILRLRPDFIKLDKTLTRGIDVESSNQQMVSALLTFAQGTSAAIVAEGIETESERSKLLEIGVTFGQGYLLGAPGPLSI